jgi:pSer/pThr/pTyr-binding forkhead associated (FHA) protein
MAEITLQVLDGVDRGKVYARLHTPVSLGREEGNTVQLNDERVSRFHAKIQEDQGQVVLTDLESTNGTRLNGEPVQLTILRIGDRIVIGRTMLLFGSPEEIDRQMPARPGAGEVDELNRTRPSSGATLNLDTQAQNEELRFQLNYHADEINPDSAADGDTPPRPAPPLPINLSPAQAAQLAELLLYLHQRLAHAAQGTEERAEDVDVRLSRAAWRRILGVTMDLAKYIYQIGHPD